MAKVEESKQVVDESKNPKGTKIVFTDRIEIKATKAAKHLIAGDVYSVHPILGDKLIKKGYAIKL